MLTEDTDGVGRHARHDRVLQLESPEEALTRVTAVFAEGGEGWVQAGSRGGQHGEAQVCVVHGRYLHVVGMSPMAWRLCELVVAGAAPGWALHSVRPGRTPLDRLAEPLLALSGAVRFYNLLLRGGFATVEEVEATPDADLLLLRQVGPVMVVAVRLVLGGLGLGSSEDAHPARAGFMAERLTRITSLLAESQRERYRDFAGMMARSSLPPRRAHHDR